MTQANLYEDIAMRTGGDIYIGVVGPVRSGKSTFIKQFMNTLVLPNIGENFTRERATDELPQSSAGRTIMTTEPKFIPENAVHIQVDDSAGFSVRLIDCVGYIVPSSLGYIENDQPRMVMTPWYTEPVPFNMAAEIGTKKVITEHSTIGLVVTTDGSISDIPREEYAEAEQRVIRELQEINKPFAVLLNCMDPTSPQATSLAAQLSEEYAVPVVPVNCLSLSQEDITRILSDVLYEFPLREMRVDYPTWVNALPLEHPIRQAVFSRLMDTAGHVTKMRQLTELSLQMPDQEYLQSLEIRSIQFGNGSAEISLTLPEQLFYDVLREVSGLPIDSEADILNSLTDYATLQKDYAKFKDALDEVEATGYGIVMPSIEELSLQEPEIMKQGGRYGVRLRASAPSIHMMKADITTEVSPIVGSEKQSEDLIMYLLSEFEEDPIKIWDSNIFGKSLHELVNEGLHTKLARMPMDARMRLQETLEKVINEGCSGLICIIL